MHLDAIAHLKHKKTHAHTRPYTQYTLYSYHTLLRKRQGSNYLCDYAIISLL
jgi:hypothetical protein